MRFLRIFVNLSHGPCECSSEDFIGNGATCLTDSRQPLQSPFLRSAIFELLHQESVHQHHQVHIPGLALAAAQLTRSHAQLLCAVAVKGFCAGPTITVRLENPIDFPSSAVRDQSLREFLVTTVVPNQDYSHWMLHLRQAYCSGEVPLTRIATPQLTAPVPLNRSSELVRPNALTTHFQFAIGFQIAHVGPRLSLQIFLLVNVVETLCAGNIAVKCEIAGNVTLANPMDKLAEQYAMVVESFTRRFALLAFLEASELQGIVFRRWAVKDLPAARFFMGE